MYFYFYTYFYKILALINGNADLTVSVPLVDSYLHAKRVQSIYWNTLITSEKSLFTLLCLKKDKVCVCWYIYFTFIYEFVCPFVHFHNTHLARYVHNNTHTHCSLFCQSVNLHFEQHLQHSPKRAKRWLKEQLSGTRLFVCVCVCV